MAPGLCRLPAILGSAKIAQAIGIVSISLLVASSVARAQMASPSDGSQSTSSSGTNSTAPDLPPIVVPAQTQLALVLMHPVDSKSMHRGDILYAQTTAPVEVGNQVAIPAGTFVQGPIEKISRNGDRGEFVMQSVSVLFPNGYTAKLPGPAKIESDEWTAWRNPGGATKAGAIIAPMAGAGIGAAIGSAAHTTQSSTLGETTITQSTGKGVAIGSAVGLAAGAVVSVALLLHSRSFYVAPGAPMDLTIGQPLTLAADEVPDAVRAAASQSPPAVPNAPVPIGSAPPAPSTNTGTCYTPGTPGTPPTIIPGTPAIGDSPGTPPTIIPGTPPIPGTAYPCP
jgi:hypothetical protein